MKAMDVTLQYCYGIKYLQHNFNFNNHKAYAIYAPNGSMKSSFAKVFKDISQGVESTDRVFPYRETIRNISDENEKNLRKDDVLVIPPYDETFGYSENTSTLLINSELKSQYESLHKNINDKKQQFVEALKKQSGSKKDIEKELSSAFLNRDNGFHRALSRIKDEIRYQNDAPFSHISYDSIFDDKVLNLLDSSDVKNAIEEYINKYNELLDASTFFKKGVFNYHNADIIAKDLAKNGFFKANHQVVLNGTTPINIKDEKELSRVIQEEKEEILGNEDLRKRFDKIEGLLQKNANVRNFQEYLSNHEDILPELNNINEFKEKLWKSYIIENIDLYNQLLNEYEAAESKTDDIISQARNERTQWERTIEIFNNRFFVPFKLTIKNRIAVILGEENLPTLDFTFEDNEESTSIEKSELMSTLSSGEKKALYILNIIFEIEARRANEQKTLFVIDDIADSFDYKNKYAIIQYLKDILNEDFFYQIIMTHNFDFFRTLESRFVMYSHCLLALKTDHGISLEKAEGIKNIFLYDWKENFHTDNKKRIASIPFIRNLIEYTHGTAHDSYLQLTSLLHWKSYTPQIKQCHLDNIFNDLTGFTLNYGNPNQYVIRMIEDEADYCLKAPEGLNFENKIVLSLATRLYIDRFMINKINDQSFTDNITGNQTTQLFDKYQELFPDDTRPIEIIDRVLLMTPENIHLNSFMYEPIVDMSDLHLRQLYLDVKNYTG